MPLLSSSAPAQTWAAVTPHDSTNIAAQGVRALYIGGAGNLVAVGLDDVAVTFTAVAAGSVLPLAAKRVNSTSTTATLIVALY